MRGEDALSRLAAALSAARTAFRKAWEAYPSPVSTRTAIDAAFEAAVRKPRFVTSIAELQDLMPFGTRVMPHESVPPGQVWVGGAGLPSPREIRTTDFHTLGVHKGPSMDPAAVVTSVRTIPDPAAPPITGAKARYLAEMARRASGEKPGAPEPHPEGVPMLYPPEKRP